MASKNPSHFLSPLRRRLINTIMSVALGAFFVTGIIMSGQVTAAAPVFAAAVDVPLDVELSGQQAIVLESGRMRVLYEQNSQLPVSIPVAAKLMTAIITAEQLLPETMITISSVAAQVPDQANNMGQPLLRTGEKYSYQYLLLRMLFYDSDAAALALAEQVSGEEALFIDLMNAKAQKLELSETSFSRVSTLTGSPMISTDETVADLSKTAGTSLTAVTSLQELARLLDVAMQNTLLADTIQRSSEYQVLEGPVVVSMHHQLESLWTLSDDRVQGVVYSNRQGATTLTFGEVNGMSLITVVVDGLPNQAINDTLKLYAAIDQHFEVATLVNAGEHFFGSQEKTLDGETFGLIYLKTVTYTRPIGQDFLKSTVQYQSFGPFSRPILSGVVIGQAIFQLLDGTTVAVDVGPDRQILSSVSIYDRALKQLQKNPNLTIILLLMLVLLAVVILLKIIFSFTRLSRLAKLLFFEIRSRR
ncbi:MAG: hypothetical protein PHC86_06295 [Eubacteriales bacterium]|nr:hypothetical protein [Eubacteriales bacterium]